MKITKLEQGFEVRYRGHTMAHPDWETELDAASDTMSALVGLPVKIERSDEGGWAASVHRLRFETPDCRLVFVADNIVTLAAAIHRAAEAQYRHSTAGAEPQKRDGLLWVDTLRMPETHKVGKVSP